LKSKILIITGALAVALSQSLVSFAGDVQIVTRAEVEVPALVLDIKDLKAIPSFTPSYKLIDNAEIPVVAGTDQFGGAVLANLGNAATMNYHGPTETKLTLALVSSADTIPQRARAVPFRWRF